MTVLVAATTLRQLPGPAATRPCPDLDGFRPPVFVVDDDECLRVLVGDWVAAAGFRTVLLGDGEACLAALAQERPFAVILDLHMGGISGAETLDLIRSIDASVPVITLSGDADPAVALDLVDRGTTEFLVKPVRRTRLVQSLLACAGSGHTFSHA